MVRPLDVSERLRQPELMDDPAIDPAEHRRALAGLQRINRLSHVDRPLLVELALLAREQPTQELRILDLACGGGDVAIRLAQRAHGEGMRLCVWACDTSPTALALGEQRARQCGADVRFFQCDALRDPLPDGFDAILCTLFLHHLETGEVGRLLGRMAAATRRLVLASDLHRSRSGYLAAWLGTRLLSRSRVVHIDGPRSVRAAFTRAEVASLAEEAGLHGTTVRRIWPWRWLLRWRRP